MNQDLEKVNASAAWMADQFADRARLAGVTGPIMSTTIEPAACRATSKMLRHYIDLTTLQDKMLELERQRANQYAATVIDAGALAKQIRGLSLAQLIRFWFRARP